MLLGACQDVTPGYLQTEYAGYTMDSMVVKKVLDLTPPEPNPTFEMYVNNYGYEKEFISQFFVLSFCHRNIRTAF